MLLAHPLHVGVEQNTGRGLDVVRDVGSRESLRRGRNAAAHRDERAVNDVSEGEFVGGARLRVRVVVDQKTLARLGGSERLAAGPIEHAGRGAAAVPGLLDYRKPTLPAHSKCHWPPRFPGAMPCGLSYRATTSRVARQASSSHAARVRFGCSPSLTGRNAGPSGGGGACTSGRFPGATSSRVKSLSTMTRTSGLPVSARHRGTPRRTARRRSPSSRPRRIARRTRSTSARTASRVGAVTTPPPRAAAARPACA